MTTDDLFEPRVLGFPKPSTPNALVLAAIAQGLAANPNILKDLIPEDALDRMHVRAVAARRVRQRAALVREAYLIAEALEGAEGIAERVAAAAWAAYHEMVDGEELDLQAVWSDLNDRQRATWIAAATDIISGDPTKGLLPPRAFDMIHAIVRGWL